MEALDMPTARVLIETPLCVESVRIVTPRKYNHSNNVAYLVDLPLPLPDASEEPVTVDASSSG